jgi:hypothetical protein
MFHDKRGGVAESCHSIASIGVEAPPPSQIRFVAPLAD